MIFENREQFINALELRRQSGAPDGIGLTAQTERTQWVDMWDTFYSFFSKGGVSQFVIQDFTTIDTTSGQSTLVSQTMLAQPVIGDIIVEVPTENGSILDKVQYTQGGKGYYLLDANGSPIYDRSGWVAGRRLGAVNYPTAFEDGQVIRLWYTVRAPIPSVKGYQGELTAKLDIALTAGQNTQVVHNFGPNSIISNVLFVPQGSRRAISMPIDAASVTDTTVVVQPTGNLVGRLIISGYIL